MCCVQYGQNDDVVCIFFLCFVLFCSPSFIDLLSNRDNFPVTKKKRKRKKNIMMIILLDGWRKKPARPCLCYLYYIVLCNIMTKYCHYRYMVLVLKEIKKIFWPSIIWNLLQTWRKRRKKIIHSFGGVWIENRLKIYWIPKVQDEWSKCERMNEWRKNLTIAKQQQMLIIWLNQQTLFFLLKWLFFVMVHHWSSYKNNDNQLDPTFVYDWNLFSISMSSNYFDIMKVCFFFI